MRGKPWTFLEQDLLRRFYRNTSMPVLASIVGHSASSIKQKAHQLGLRRCERFRWTPAAEQLLRDRYAHTPSAELARELGCPVGTVHKQAMKLRLAKSRECVVQMARERTGPDHPLRQHGFKAGIRPWNTGLKITLPDACKATQFKKGQRPHTTLPIGSQRVSPEGYLEVKFADVPGRHDKRWIPVHRQRWIQAHGPVPPGHVVAFKPGRKTTDPALITLDAIELITLKENMARNTIHARLSPELAEISRLRGTLKRAINRANRNKDQDHARP